MIITTAPVNDLTHQYASILRLEVDLPEDGGPIDDGQQP